MDKYKEYLAANVLNEGKIVSYRTLSIALKVHVNLAKQMLYDFHQKQNAKKPGSVHATYLLIGRPRPDLSQHTNGTHIQDGADSIMQGSPPVSSMPEREETEEEVVPVTKITLATEEKLEETKTQYEEITSIHVYSLQPVPLKSMQLISSCNQEIAAQYDVENPLEAWKTYGTIYNPIIKRRSGAKQPPPPAPVATTAAAKTAPKPSSTVVAKEKEPVQTKDKNATPQVDAAAIPAKKADTKAPSLRREKSDIFKSFAKAKPKAKAGSAESSAAPSPAPVSQEDVSMADDSDGGEEPDLGLKPSADDSRNLRAERERKLREMMEEDDEPTPDEPMPDAPEAVEEAEAEDAPLDKQPEPKQPEKTETVTVSGGRRRGRRRVMKKKTVKDEEGYLVTKEEPVWESFSEDEPAPKKMKTPVSSLSTAKGKKAGQGSIMSFFSKK